MVIDAGESQVFKGLGAQCLEQPLVRRRNVDFATRHGVDDALEFNRIHRIMSGWVC
jgi:hypothetical protein